MVTVLRSEFWGLFMVLMKPQKHNVSSMRRRGKATPRSTGCGAGGIFKLAANAPTQSGTLHELYTAAW
jgi:hypothetical protein